MRLFVPTVFDTLSLQLVERRRLTFAFSAALLVLSLVLLGVRGVNFGIDFKGGILLEARTTQAADIEGLRATIGKLGLGDVAIQTFGAPMDVLIRIQRQAGGEGSQQQAVSAVKEALHSEGIDIAWRRTEFVGPKVSAELLEQGIIAVVLAIVGILFYVWVRFEWHFGAGAVLALVHDVVTTLGFFSLFGLEFNLSTVAAVLTIAGYSINDTVVIYDRVRENLRKYKKLELAVLLNNSIMQTLSRTVMTSVTTLLALIALVAFGGPVIQDFSLAMIFGIFIGTYSSIFLAVPLLVNFRLDRVGNKEDEADGIA